MEKLIKMAPLAILLIFIQIIKLSHGWEVKFEMDEMQIHMDTHNLTYFNVTNIDTYQITSFKFVSEAPHIADVEFKINETDDESGKRWSGFVNVTGNFLGELNIIIHVRTYERILIRFVQIILHVLQ